MLARSALRTTARSGLAVSGRRFYPMGDRNYAPNNPTGEKPVDEASGKQSKGSSRWSDELRGAPGGPSNNGTTKVYNKDGTNPNKNYVYIGAGLLGLGAMYYMFSGGSTSSNPGKDPRGGQHDLPAHKPASQNENMLSRGG
ncbi:hypothetical protein QBC46DRAFT_378870 [Diplogelasinospora grovesii]|uniref:Uncharacterized protein n=1 Tax=Diplogelasinospora grovesii TaxID=303347 RepID=A0AAN6NC95_9PEZI|nr:hypothetical protein QBC46DRAFT_378870 [Diplogelasinospora grovesii]